MRWSDRGWSSLAIDSRPRRSNETKKLGRPARDKGYRNQVADMARQD